MSKKVIIWGIGVEAEYVYSTLLPNCEIVALIDSDFRKQNKIWKENLVIMGPEVIQKLEFDYIIVTPQNYDPIEKQILLVGVESTRIICYWKDEEAQDIFQSRSIKLLEERKSKDIYRARLDSAPYEWGLKTVPVIESEQSLLRIILSEKKSLSRFGDGEYEIMRGKERAWFQSTDKKLAERLIKVFQSNDERILVAAAQNFINLERYKDSDADHIRVYMEGKTRDDIIHMFSSERKYYDAYVSRPYIMHKTAENAKEIFGLFKKIFKNRNIIMVEGEYGRTGVGNDLFNTAKNVKRIVCPATNAWSLYDKILKCVMQNAKKDDLICISLGPTASVLAFDLAVNGFQALDIGQIDNEYEWYIRDAQFRIPIKGKMVAEVKNHYEKDEIIDAEYAKDVICKVE